MSRYVLILGGHGKIARILSQQLLKKAWASLTSHQRNLNDLAHSLEDVKDVSQAKSILEEVNPDAVIWSTGAGGKGGPDRTFAIDRDAAINFIKATVQTSSISKFSLISYLACRRKSPTWWESDAWSYA
ncbi:hypothetical protein ACJ41O_005664 [Fusarium nematophilum]